MVDSMEEAIMDRAVEPIDTKPEVVVIAQNMVDAPSENKEQYRAYSYSGGNFALLERGEGFEIPGVDGLSVDSPPEEVVENFFFSVDKDVFEPIAVAKAGDGDPLEAVSLNGVRITIREPLFG